MAAAIIVSRMRTSPDGGPSCKERKFCPSCGQKRAVEFGEWLCGHVLRAVPYRHFVFSIPKILRRFFLHDRKLLAEAMTPMAVEVALAVQQEIQTRLDEADRLRGLQVERARYEAESARRRYMHVDPANRLVADSLEAEWNEKLRELAKAEENYERGRDRDRKVLDETQRKRLSSLVQDFPAVWDDPRTPSRERKRMVSLLIEDVTLIKKEEIVVQVRFRGGATTMLNLPLPLNAWQGRKTTDYLLAQIDVPTTYRPSHSTHRRNISILLPDDMILYSGEQGFHPFLDQTAVTEPNAGSDVGGILTTAVRDGDEFVINGSKIFITNGVRANWKTARPLAPDRIDT